MSATKFDGKSKAAVLDLLYKMHTRLDNQSQRLNTVGRESSSTRDMVTQMADTDRLQAVKFAEALKASTDSLYMLRNSTAESFVAVKKDYQAYLEGLQRLNERISKLEGQNALLITENKILRSDLEYLKTENKALGELRAAFRLFIKG